MPTCKRFTHKKQTVSFSSRSLRSFFYLVAIWFSIGSGLPVRAIEFPDTGDRGAPSRTTGGGTRGEECQRDSHLRSQRPAHALVPRNNVSTFTSDQATLWIHVSETFVDSTAEIYVKDTASNQTVYEQQFPVSALLASGLEQERLLKVELPRTTALGLPLLKTNQDYHWEFSIICHSSDRTQDYVLQGLFHRVEVDPERLETLAIAAPDQQIAQYASAGLWQETLETAASLKEEQPQIWTQLLSSVGLEALTDNG